MSEHTFEWPDPMGMKTVLAGDDAVTQTRLVRLETIAVLDRRRGYTCRAETLAELARRFLDSPHAPTDHGNRPHVTVVVDWQTLTGERPGGLSELLDGTVVPPAHARRLACDAQVCRLLTGPYGEILDLGRSQRTVSSAQWKALRIRDRHCQWPSVTATGPGATPTTSATGPDRTHRPRQSHPPLPQHHTLIHRSGWELSGTPDNLTIARPDGTNLPNAPP